MHSGGWNWWRISWKPHPSIHAVPPTRYFHNAVPGAAHGELRLDHPEPLVFHGLDVQTPLFVTIMPARATSQTSPYRDAGAGSGAPRWAATRQSPSDSRDPSFGEGSRCDSIGGVPPGSSACAAIYLSSDVVLTMFENSFKKSSCLCVRKRITASLPISLAW